MSTATWHTSIAGVVSLRLCCCTGGGSVAGRHACFTRSWRARNADAVAIWLRDARRPQLRRRGCRGEAMRVSGRVVLVVSARFVTTTMSTNCELLELIRAGDGRKVNVSLATQLPFEDPLVSGGTPIDPGTETQAWPICSRHDSGHVVELADARGMAKIAWSRRSRRRRHARLFDVFQPLLRHMSARATCSRSCARAAGPLIKVSIASWTQPKNDQPSDDGGKSAAV